MTGHTQPCILITRLSALGDCITTLPVACAIKDVFPFARIVWLSQPENAALLRAHPDIDEVITVHRRWFWRIRHVLRLRARLQQEKFDFVLDPQSLSKSSTAAWLSGCSQRIGLDAPLGREVAPMLNRISVSLPIETHVVDRFLALLKPLGINNPEVRFRIPITAGAERRADEFLTREGLKAGFVMINPGAGWQSRRWQIDRYGAVAHWIYQIFGLHSVVNWFGSEERSMGETIVEHSHGTALLADELDLFELAGLLRRSQMFIGSDCGPMHLAAALNIPCVCLQGTTRPEISGPYGPGHIAIQKYYQSGTSRQRRAASNDAMLAITVNDVINAAARILCRDHARIEDLSRARMKSRAA